MPYEHYVDCANCGTQVKVSGPEDNCLFCGKNATKKETEPPLDPEQPESKPKEVIMVNSKEVPPKPEKRKKRAAYWEKNKEAILADYQSMNLQLFFERWRIATTTWINLKKKWGVQNKGKATGSKPAEASKEKEYKRPQPRPGGFCFLITEEDLAKLDDEQYQEQWSLIGTMIRNRRS